MLQHAVAVIEHARLEIAKHINGNIASAYCEIGKMLQERKVESGHGDGVVPVSYTHLTLPTRMPV